jgi:predicted membrane-bound mannosyltransferase
MMLPRGAALASGITRVPNFFQRECSMRRVRILLPVVILALAILALVELSGGRGVLAQAPVAADPAAAFNRAAEQTLDAMVKEATARQMKGVAVIAFVQGDATRSWASQMRVVDALVLGQANVLGIAYAKMSEMADTLENSGSGKRPPHHGELGYKGGAIRKVTGGHLLAAFSGGKDTDDLDVANLGLDLLEGVLRKE